MYSEQLIPPPSSKTFCLFCYKVDSTQNISRNSTSLKDFVEFSQRFLETPSRAKLTGVVLEYLETRSVETKSAGSTGDRKVTIELCETCLTLVKEFNELYHEMKCVELKLQYKMSTLSSIMKDAGRVNSRRRSLNELLGEAKFRELDKQRREWIQHCFRRRRHYFPRVKLRDISGTKTEVEETTPVVSCVESFCRTWLISLSAVVLLLSDPPATSSLLPSGALELDRDQEARDNSKGREDVHKTVLAERLLEGSSRRTSESVPESEKLQVENVVQVPKEVDLVLSVSTIDSYEISEEIEITTGQSPHEFGVGSESPSITQRSGNFKSHSEDIKSDAEESGQSDQEDYKREDTSSSSSSGSDIDEEEQQQDKNTSEVLARNEVLGQTTGEVNEVGDEKDLVGDTDGTEDVPMDIDFDPTTTVEEPNIEINAPPVMRGEEYNKDYPESHSEPFQHEKKVEEIMSETCIPQVLSESSNQAASIKEKVYNLRKRPMKPSEDIDCDGHDSDSEQCYPEEFKYEAHDETSSSNTSSDDNEDDAEVVQRHPSRKLQKRAINIMTVTKRAILLREFKLSTVLDPQRLSNLATRLRLKPEQVSNWFSRRGFPYRKKTTLDHSSCDGAGCEFQSQRKETFEAHQKLHKSGSFPCTSCELIMETPMQICMHEISHNPVEQTSAIKSQFNQYKCKRCPFTSTFRFVYASHFAAEHLKIPGVSTVTTHHCPLCNVEVRFPKRHFRLNHDTTGVDPDKVVKCPEDNCQAVFLRNPGLQRHLWEHHKVDQGVQAPPVQKMNCDLCILVFTTARELASHKLRAHCKFNCPLNQCGRVFDTEDDAKEHKTLHGNWKCSKCAFSSNFAPEYLLHETKCIRQKSSEGRLSCPDCDFTDRTQVRMIDHRLEVHLKLTQKIFMCKLCKDGFEASTERYKHFWSNHKGDPAKFEQCPKCFVHFNEKLQVYKHLEKCAGKIPDFFQYILRRKNSERSGEPDQDKEKNNNFCVRCVMQFRTDKEFERHSKLHGKWTCQFCPVEKEFAPDLALHEIQTHQEKGSSKSLSKRHRRVLGVIIKCPRCNWSTGRENQIYSLRFVKHFLSEHLLLDPGVHVCRVCQEGFIAESEVAPHMKDNHRGKDGDKYKCDECPAFFKKPSQLVIHKRNIHKSDQFEITCKHCKKTFGCRKSLISHTRKFHEDMKQSKAFPCDEPKCGKSFDTNEDLMWHKARNCKLLIMLKEQSEGEIVICQICGRSWKGEIALKSHMRIHDPGRPTEFKCPICSKSFKNKPSLQRHEEYHKDPSEWKYMCALCSRKCVNKHKLEEHMRTHSKEKPFVCQVCGEKYAHNHNLRNHIKSKHKEVEVEVQVHNRPIQLGPSRKGKKLKQNFRITRKDIGEGQDSSDSSLASD